MLAYPLHLFHVDLLFSLFLQALGRKVRDKNVGNPTILYPASKSLG